LITENGRSPPMPGRMGKSKTGQGTTAKGYPQEEVVLKMRAGGASLELPQGWDIDWDDDTFSERKAVFFDNLWREYPPSCRFVPPSA